MSFDPQAFLDMAVTGENDTKLIPIPIGEYLGVTEECKLVPWQSKEDPSKSGLKFEVMIAIDDAAAKAATGRDNLKIKHEGFLDLMPGGTGFDMSKGKNIALGQLRAALGLNNASEEFRLSMIAGRPIRVSVGHREYNGNMVATSKGVTKP